MKRRYRLDVGTRISWVIRPERPDTPRLQGTIRSVCKGYFMVGTGKMLKPHPLDPVQQEQEQRLAVAFDNSTIEILGYEK